eukprot:501597_1
MSHSQCDIDVNLWSFIKCTKATQLAPLRVLQEFVLSLNKRELTHLIKSYLQSKLSTNNTFNANGLTMRQTAHRLLNNTTINHTLRTVDTQIVSKLTQRYGMKYRRNVISHTQQTNSDCKRMNLLSIHPQVLAYSFQFLSFRELCKVQSVCVHFTYLNKHYPALTHYYFKLDKKFLWPASRFKVPLSNLSFFKHIEVNILYCNLDYWNKDPERRTKLFQLMLKTVITQSKSSLDILTIDIPPRFRNCNTAAIVRLSPFNILLYIMNEFDHLNVSKLYWNQDYFKPSNDCDASNMLQQIKPKLVHSFPRLRSLSIGAKYFFTSQATWYAQPKDIPRDILIQHLLSPAIHGFGAKLESLQIDSHGTPDLFDNNTNLVQLITSCMVNLKTLSISLPQANSVTTVTNPTAMIQHTKLRKLSVKNVDRNAEDTNNYLTYLFSIFIGITDFECEYRRQRSDSSILLIAWRNIFFTLVENKRTYSVNTGHILPALQSLKFDEVTGIDHCLIMNSLLSLRITTLVHLEMNVRWWRGKYVALMTRVSRLLKLYRRCSSKLRSIKLGYCGWEKLENFNLQPIMDVLSNRPPATRSIHIELPGMRVTSQKRKEIESVKFIQCLCQLLSEPKGTCELEAIHLDNLRIPLSSRKHLLFWFGFQNSISIVKDSYYLNFI